MDWMRYRLLYFLVSAIIIAAGIFSIVHNGFNLSIDFTGGTVVEYEKTDGSRFVERHGVITQEQAQKPDAKIVRFESVGPTFSAEIFKKTLVAVAVAAGGILLWVAIQFRSFSFGVSAVIATIHDVVILLGVFSLLGKFYGAPVDILFVTALLTALAFSVHDTIVVFDRIRENKKKIGGPFYGVANESVTQTMVRSLNTSLTIVFVLIALILLGGQTLFWFSIALLIGTVTGAYSSPFIAVPLLLLWEDIRKKLRR